jgi:hypothetical protein
LCPEVFVDKVGYIDIWHKIRIPALYESGLAFREGKAGVRLDGKWGFIDKFGKIVGTPVR